MFLSKSIFGNYFFAFLNSSYLKIFSKNECFLCLFDIIQNIYKYILGKLVERQGRKAMGLKAGFSL